MKAILLFHESDVDGTNKSSWVELFEGDVDAIKYRIDDLNSRSQLRGRDVILQQIIPL